MQIWLTIPSLAQKTGGPATVVQHLSEHLVATGAAVTVLTGAVEATQVQVLPRDARVKVVTLAAGTSSRSQIRDAISAGLGAAERDVIHDFGVWLPANHGVVSVSQELGIPLVISPCGMLAPWALRHKRWKKLLAWWLYQRRDLFRAAVLVATAEQEARDIRARVMRKPVALIPNGVEIPIQTETLKAEMLKLEGGGQKSEVRGPDRTVVFLGRIHPVKGLRNLVEAWRQVRPSGWKCIVAGPDEAGHQAELEALLREHDLQNEFQFPGMLADAAKRDLLKQADLFVLPSFTENFGVAAAEALACGVPVIASKGTPWHDLVKHHCGWWVEIGVEPLAKVLRQACALSDEDRSEMGLRGRQLVTDQYCWPKIATDLKAVYHWVLDGGNRPGCIGDG